MDQSTSRDLTDFEITLSVREVQEALDASEADIRDGRVEDAAVMVAELRAKHAEFLARRGAQLR